MEQDFKNQNFDEYILHRICDIKMKQYYQKSFHFQEK